MYVKFKQTYNISEKEEVSSVRYRKKKTTGGVAVPREKYFDRLICTFNFAVLKLKVTQDT